MVILDERRSLDETLEKSLQEEEEGEVVELEEYVILAEPAPETADSGPSAPAEEQADEGEWVEIVPEERVDPPDLEGSS